MANSPPNRHGVFKSGLLLIQNLLFDPQYFWALATLVILGDATLTSLIVQYVPCTKRFTLISSFPQLTSGFSDTEIDWETYMIQTKAFLSGQYNYTLITGPTGPLVYPAGHVRVHQFLYDITNDGKNIPFAQWIYSTLYIASLFLSCSIYQLAGNVPNWAILLLPLSKRLHSIYVLRLFNDCWAVVAVQASILAFQRGYFDTGMMLFSFALSVKMSILLYLPGLLVILVKRRGLVSTFTSIVTLLTTQMLFAIPFLKEDPWAYLSSAFEFDRVFLYKWTVNWRFFDEDTFLSPRLSTALLVGHLSLLVAFGLFKWCERDGGTWFVIRRALTRPLLPAEIALTTPDFIATVLFTSNLIGILFARSLHYQFYSWYCQQIPFLTWRTRYPTSVKVLLFFGIEYAWNVFPSTFTSSAILLACNILLVVGIWFGYPNGKRTFVSGN
ncbi:glycosyltransferase family 58 protein [Panaeolus papilionaceus]|nr:glycosyltransferase family 58 protein [Panaeolus papilionaceus]